MVSFTSVSLVSWALFAHPLAAQVLSSSSLPINNPTASISSSNTFRTNAASVAGGSTARSSSANRDVTAIAGRSTTTPVVVGTAVASASSASSTNTRACNGYVEFCERKFSNVSMVVAHNSPFVRANNAASNQILPVLTQLNDGIRGLQFETQKPNSSSAIRLCHTSCDILDVGTLETYLSTVKGWLDDHPYEVISIIMGNNNGQSTRIPASDYVSPFEDAGMIDYLYTPSMTAMNLTDWPTLSEMIITNKRVVVMMDYGTDQSEVPWLLSEFDYQWETPFSPTDPSFPCTQQRPANQTEAVSRNRMYMMNHNLNIEVDIASLSILIPAYSLLDEVNAVSGNGSVGRNVQGCEALWDRPPNWILVDYYNFGNFNGSVFQVAATANNVSYNTDSCCGANTASAAPAVAASAYALAVAFLFLVVCA